MADWMEYVTLIASVATAGAAIAGVVVARSGLRTWRAQLRGADDHRVAKELSRQAGRLANSMKSVRLSPVSNLEHEHARQFFSRSDMAPRSSNQEAVVRQYRAMRYLMPAVGSLHDAAFEARITWDSIPDAEINAMLDLATELDMAVCMYAGDDQSEDVVAIACVRGPQPDEFAARVDAACDQLQQAVRHHLRP